MNRFNGDVYIVLTTREIKSTLMMSLTFCSVRNDRTSDVCEIFSLRPEVRSSKAYGVKKSVFAEKLLSRGAILIKFRHSNLVVTSDKL